jgi:hypothetical protein
MRLLLSIGADRVRRNWETSLQASGQCKRRLQGVAHGHSGRGFAARHADFPEGARVFQRCFIACFIAVSDETVVDFGSGRYR